ncbi:MAG: hypothetical protein GY861_25415 [bacterium]|nr:hypothetical protein [bacterium]
MTTTDKDYGWKKIMRQLKVADNSYTKIGVQSEDANKEHGDSTLIVIAATNEFGTKKAGKNRNVVIPERSYIRSSFDKNKRKYNSMISDSLNKMYKRKLTFKKALQALGETAEQDIKGYMTALQSPANASSTKLKKKGADNPLIDTGQLRNSIRHVEAYK